MRDTWTWDAAEEIIRKLTIDTDGDGAMDQWGHSVFTLTDPDVMQAMILSNGGQIFSPDFKNYLIDEPKSIEALNWLAQMDRTIVSVKRSTPSCRHDARKVWAI